MVFVAHGRSFKNGQAKPSAKPPATFPRHHEPLPDTRDVATKRKCLQCEAEFFSKSAGQRALRGASRHNGRDRGMIAGNEVGKFGEAA